MTNDICDIPNERQLDDVFQWSKPLVQTAVATLGFFVGPDGICDDSHEVQFGVPPPSPVTPQIVNPGYAPYDAPIAKFELAIESIPVGNGVSIRLFEPPLMKFTGDIFRAEIENWGVEIGTQDEKSKVSAKLGAKFLKLFHKAQAGDLSAEEEEQFVWIDSICDTGAYIHSLKRPVYDEGVWSFDGKSHRIEFCFGDERIVPEKVINDLHPCTEGEWFAAYFQTDREGEIVGACNPYPIDAPLDLDQFEE